jgi:hypothetical protein
LKVFSILSSLLIVCPVRTAVQACSYMSEVEELRYMLFNPDLLHNKSWWTFFYNGKLNYLDGATFSAEDETILAAEWMKELKLTGGTHDALSCLFGSLTDSALQQNSFYKEIQKRQDAKKYFALARSCEEIVSTPPPWDEDAQYKEARDSILSPMIQSVNGILKTGTNPFFKKKYAFQLARLAFYANDVSLFNTVYNRYFAGEARKNILDWWALHYKSMVLEREAKIDSANYLHALVFSHSSNKMFVSKQYFSRKNLEATISLAQNDAERADIYLLAAVINPGRSLEEIQRIYALAPDHRHLPLLISREINKLEDWLGTTKFANAHIATDYWGETPVMENWQRDYDYLQEVIGALEKMPALAIASPVYYNLSMTCLNLMKGNATAAAKYLDMVKTDDPEIKYQVNVLKTVLIVLEKDITDASVQDEIGTLYQSLIREREMKFESQKTLYSLSSFLRYSFANKGMVHLAGLFDNYAINKFCHTCDAVTFEYSLISYFDRYASASDLEKLIRVYDRSGKNHLEQVLLRPYSNPYYFLDLLSTKYLRQGDVKNAMLTAQKIPDTFWPSFFNASFYLDSDPFLNNKELFGTETMTTYNKREILEKLYQLEQEAAQDASKRRQNYFLLGNAWYNFTQHSWFMISYGWSDSAPDNKVYAVAYGKALEYYKRSLSLESDDEGKAKLLYMVALLSDAQKTKTYAKEYERYHETAFYKKKNCLTLKDLADANGVCSSCPCKVSAGC